MTQRKLGKLQAGFAPFIIIAIIAVLAIGGGAYVVSKNKAKAPVPEDNPETQANAQADANANANANLGLNAKGSLRSLMGMGKNVMCTFESTSGSTASSGTVYIAANGSMRGDFKAAGLTSGMITKDGYMYGWTDSSSSGMKIKMDAQEQAEIQTEAAQAVDIDSEVDYECSEWSVDQSKFDLPAKIEFVDVKALLNAVGPGDINLKTKTEFGQ